jgi:hypothetical protein
MSRYPWNLVLAGIAFTIGLFVIPLGAANLGDVVFDDAIHQPLSNMNQDLAFAAPEPSTVVSTVLGACGFIIYVAQAISQTSLSDRWARYCGPAK